MMFRAGRLLTFFLAVIGLVAVVLTTQAGAETSDDAGSGGTDGAYIVVLNPQPDAGVQAEALTAAQARVEAAGGQIGFVYRDLLDGFSVSGLDEAAAASLAADPGVAYVERDQVYSISAEQVDPTWGLDRIDQRNLPLDDTYVYNTSGQGVTAYIVDTGVRTTHNEFGGRVVNHLNFTNDGINDDCHGHGTHVAGTVGSDTYGVAKDVTIVGLKTLGCDGFGSTSGIVAALNWVVANNSGPAVVNLSLGGPASQAMDNAVSGLVANGIPTAVAAGNDDIDACTVSPAREPDALTVGSTESDDDRSSFSNFGTCLDLFAPGSSITSTWLFSDSSTAILSGTSMASPHVAGVAALLLGANPSATPADIEAALLDGATGGVVDGPGAGSPNLLLYSLVEIDDPDPDPSSIGGQVTDSSGAAVGGVSVDLFASNPSGDRLGYLASATTDGSGSYGFDVDAGCYAITFIAPADSTFTNGSQWLNAAACVDPGQTVDGIDAVLNASGSTGTIGDQVTTADGTGVAGVAIDLFSATADGSRGGYLQSTATGAGGLYSFEANPGCYVVTFIAPADSTFTNGQGWLNSGVCITAGETVDTVDAVLVSDELQATIVGSVSEAGDGSPVGGVAVDLFTATADGSRGSYLRSTTTDNAQGEFAFENTPGCYVLTFIAPGGRTFTNGQGWLNIGLCVDPGETSTGHSATLS